MKRRLFLLPVLVFFTVAANAQTRDVTVQTGMNIPLYDEVESDVVNSVSYGCFGSRGLGYRVGLQWSPSVADVDDYIGVPVSFSYRVGGRSTHDRLNSGFSGAMDSAAHNNYLYDGDAGGMLGTMLSGFLMNLFGDMEFFAGATPGYVAGSSSTASRQSWAGSEIVKENWTEKRYSAALTLDAGMSLNYNIWRFDIKVTPAFHYNLLPSLVYHESIREGSTVHTSTEIPLRWSFTFSGGIAFRF